MCHYSLKIYRIGYTHLYAMNTEGWEKKMEGKESPVSETPQLHVYQISYWQNVYDQENSSTFCEI
jgi:hypothetical protein